MIQTTITYFAVSPETVYDGKHGHMVRIAYKFGLDDDLLNSDVVKYFDFIEDIVFKMEWKKEVSDDEHLLIWDRELPVYPTKRFSLERENKRSTKCFLPREFLAIENGFPERASLFCRISLIPVLTSKRREVSYQPHGSYYVLDNVAEGDPSEYTSGNQGNEY